MSFLIFPKYEYTVKIPDPNGDYSKNKEDYEFDFNIDEKKKPVIILFGWVGSTDRYLSIYSRIYEAKGLMTVRFMVSMTSIFLWKHHIIPISEKMVRVIEDLSLGDRPIIIHCFSNGGTYLYRHFMEAVESSKTPIKIKGVIFDSAPCRRTILHAFRGIRSTVRQNPFLNLPITLILFLILLSVWVVEFIKRYLFRRKIIQFKPMEHLLQEENRCPQHFIYTTCDKVIDVEDIEFFINSRKALGVDVSVKRYNDTEHVKHYPVKKYTYTQSIFNFISKCLELNSSIV
ncbi:transmembrane protein 53-like [Coccinella septempunctata]|uniref:transmembrane protein 53-like n=1 Tax=Coccinella septempunctata TaxID=41139 RepID=UPI001D087714|nr:transmembrane protein 53-like [Coccinella septempunctata]